MFGDGELVTISAEHRKLNGFLTVPPEAIGLVLFAHGSGSGRFSSRNQFVARVLQAAGIATLLFDLLDESEADDREKVFDIKLLARRLMTATDWVGRQDQIGDLDLGYFGASTGAGAALLAASERADDVKAVIADCRRR
jgi:putative phosphoribosyl transferase